MCTYKKAICCVLGIPLALGFGGTIPHIVKAEMSLPYKEEWKRPTIITQENNGEHIHISTGQFLSLSLAENPTTGYRWTTTNINHQIPLVGEHFQPNNTGDGTAGKPGVTKLQLKKWRSWEGDSSIIDTFYVWVHVETPESSV
ncbi:protease inhibitor I42 family protein [Bacillus tropicus]|uniref:protease inhibitor I42 family protein n=1 Tax=Bacillus tropicus TaxID=2026188 RepID=UPI0026D49BB5|nr:protease inhibitor I42 family protein [Bacillus tropicus]